MDKFHCLIISQIVDNIVLQTNREARRRTRTWNESNPEEPRVEWKPIDGDEVMAFIGLCILAGVYRSNHKPVATLWSEREGRPCSLRLCPEIDLQTYMRFDDKELVESDNKVTSLLHSETFGQCS